MSTWIARRAEILREFVSWRGVFIVGLLTVREFLRPLLYWHLWYIFETDISNQVPQPYGKDAVEVNFYAEGEPATIVQQISAMGELEAEEVERRFARGDSIAVGWVEDEPAGYMWMSVSNAFELAFDTFWIVRAGEAVRYGSFVSPAFRGRGIHSSLNSAVNSCLRQRGIEKTLGAVSLLNPQSLSLPRHYKRAVAMTVLVVRFRRPNWTIRKSFGAPLESRFSWAADLADAKSELKRS
jgi:GNAT superfamily N-acetyltransferase